MTNLLFARGDSVRFQRDEDRYDREGVITMVDKADPSLPYNVAVDGEGTYWCAETDILERLPRDDSDRMVRIEAKLDALLTHLGVKVN